MAAMVAIDYLGRRLVSMWEFGRPVWMYTGDHDFGRT